MTAPTIARLGVLRASDGPVVVPPQAARAQAILGSLFVAPFVIGVTFFLILPTLGILVLAFTDWQLGSAQLRFAGVGNFVQLFQDRVFRQSAINTLIYSVIVTPASVLLGLWLAVTIENLTFGKALFRAIFFLPVVGTMVATAVVFEFLLHPTLGPVNGMVTAIGLAPLNFLGDAELVLPTLAAIGIWQSTGYNMILITAGLRSIPRELYEAAAVEGADRPYERFWNVTLPLLGPTLLFVVVVSFLNSFRVFETVAALTQGGPRYASEVVLFSIYREGFVYFHVGYASALTVMFLVVLFTLTLLQARLMDRRVHYS